MPDVAIIGAGQAGLAASVCLSRLGIDHVVLEKYEIGASWRRQRWDSFCLVTPNWSVRLPGQDYCGSEPVLIVERSVELALSIANLVLAKREAGGGDKGFERNDPDGGRTATAPGPRFHASLRRIGMNK